MSASAKKEWGLRGQPLDAEPPSASDIDAKIARGPCRRQDPAHSRILYQLLNEDKYARLWDPVRNGLNRSKDKAYRLETATELCAGCLKVMNDKGYKEDTSTIELRSSQPVIVSDDEEEEEGEEQSVSSTEIEGTALDATPVTITHSSSLLLMGSQTAVSGAAETGSKQLALVTVPCAVCHRLMKLSSAHWECSMCRELSDADKSGKTPRTRLCTECHRSEAVRVTAAAKRHADLCEASVGADLSESDLIKLQLKAEVIIPGTVHDRSKVHALEAQGPTHSASVIVPSQASSSAQADDATTRNDIQASLQLIQRQRQQDRAESKAKRKQYTKRKISEEEEEVSQSITLVSHRL